MSIASCIIYNPNASNSYSKLIFVDSITAAAKFTPNLDYLRYTSKLHLIDRLTIQNTK